MLVFGEGLHEEIFLKYLRSLYALNSGAHIEIKKGKGGTAGNIVIGAYKVPGAFDRRVVVLDNDKEKSEMEQARTEAKKRHIELIEHTPCLEFMLLNILQEGKSFENKDSAWCKGEFESKYLHKKKRDDLNEYAKIFPRELIDRRRTKIAELDQIISIIEGK